MAKGKHAPNKGALKQAEKVKIIHSFLRFFYIVISTVPISLLMMQKVLHPGSRKVGRIAKKATHRGNIEIKGKVRLNSSVSNQFYE